MKPTGPWSMHEIEGWLAATVVPARLACHDASDWPTSVSLWFLYEEGEFYCATPRTAAVVGWLERDSRCTIEIAPESPPYCGVRARGRASILEDQDCELLRRVICRYLGSDRSQFARWLLDRPIEEAALRIEPVRMASWDFSLRMNPSSVADPSDTQTAST